MDTYNVEAAIENLINIIFFDRDKSKNINELKAEFAQFLRWMSVSTIFVRGQASITRSIMAALAESHGLRLHYVKDWNSFGYNPDMRALSSFDIDAFIKDFCANVELVPLD